ncbi:hypothetical protein N3930_46655, partial [Bacillus thuringiensis]|nr:hypothetical protein [Bacillus thuringiensis]
GAAYAIVVTATAEQFAQGKGEVTTQYDTPLRLEDLLKLSDAGKFYYHSHTPGTRTINIRTENRFASQAQVALLTPRDRGCT